MGSIFLFKFYLRITHLFWVVSVQSVHVWQLNPGDSVLDIRQFLLDAPETCFITCYDLLLHTKDGSTHHLEDYNEISEVADITTGGCSLEMVPGMFIKLLLLQKLDNLTLEEWWDVVLEIVFAALYDDRSIRAHVHRTRELLSLSSLHASLSTSLALQNETLQNKAASSGGMKRSSSLPFIGFCFIAFLFLYFCHGYINIGLFLYFL